MENNNGKYDEHQFIWHMNYFGFENANPQCEFYTFGFFSCALKWLCWNWNIGRIWMKICILQLQISCDLHFNRSTIFGMIFQFAIGSYVTERHTFSAKSKLWNVIFHWFNISKRKFSKANRYLTCSNVFAPQHTNTNTNQSVVMWQLTKFGTLKHEYLSYTEWTLKIEFKIFAKVWICCRLSDTCDSHIESRVRSFDIKKYANAIKYAIHYHNDVESHDKLHTNDNLHINECWCWRAYTNLS